jgi:hypothetical protein
VAESAARVCQNQVIDHLNQSTIFFCLIMKEYLTDCPVKCPYFLGGDPIHMDDLY